MNKQSGWPIAMTALVVLITLAAGCSRGEASPSSNPIPLAITEEGLGGIAAEAYALVAASTSGIAQTGIRVAGQGQVSIEPDLVLLNLGVDARAETVADARQHAASAMSRIIEALTSHQVADQDIQTTSFNIMTQYDYRDGKQNLIGYIVNNNVRVKLRDLAAIGIIIDDVAQAGGDLTRINGISFTVEDPSPYMTQAREVAVNDALAKAKQFASLTGVQLGQLVFISESGGAPVVRDFEVRAMALEAAPATTPISGGELEAQVTVQATFSIAPLQ